MPRSPKVTRTKVVHVRLTEDDWSALQETAALLHISASDVLRRGARVAGGQGPTFEGETRATILSLAGQIRMIGVNINQAVRALNAGMIPSDRELQESFGKLSYLLQETREAYLSLCSDSRVRALKALSGNGDGA